MGQPLVRNNKLHGNFKYKQYQLSGPFPAEALSDGGAGLSSCYRARAIKYRQENSEAVGGFFSQIGDLYVVHHLWGECTHHVCTVHIDFEMK